MAGIPYRPLLRSRTPARFQLFADAMGNHIAFQTESGPVVLDCELTEMRTEADGFGGETFFSGRLIRPSKAPRQDPEAAVCRWCGSEYDYLRHDYKCPNCGAPKCQR